MKAGSPAGVAISGTVGCSPVEAGSTPRLESVAIAVALEPHARTALAGLAAALDIVVVPTILASVRSAAILVAVGTSAERRPLRAIRTFVARLLGEGPFFEGLRLREMRLHLRLRSRIGRRGLQKRAARGAGARPAARSGRESP